MKGEELKMGILSSRQQHYWKTSAVILAVLLSVLISGCGKEIDPNYQTNVKNAVTQVESAINNDSMQEFCGTVCTTEVNKFFKIFALVASMFDKDKKTGKIFMFIPVSISPEEIKKGNTDDVTVELSVSYVGQMSTVRKYSETVDAAVRKVIGFGMPSEMTFVFANKGGVYKLKEVSYPMRYTPVLMTIEPFL